MFSKRLARLVAAGGLLATTGCVKQDTEILARVGRKVFDQGRDSTAGLRERLATVLPQLGGDTLQDQVSQRLRTDKSLQGIKIDVTVRDRAVELAGAVTNDEQKRRAIELAESTFGVEKVTDRLAVVAANP
jgi:hypothetical protein